MTKKPVVLCILDGWGDEKSLEFNAPKIANTPNFDKLLNNYPSSHLKACGLAVGLPEGQMGNSEVGHMNIGAGRIVMQTLPRIDKSCANKSFTDEEAFKNFINDLKQSGGTAHLMGLVSNGGVHAHINHMTAFANEIIKQGVDVKLHVFTDGRDTAPAISDKVLNELQSKTKAPIVTVSGRYWAMDRDNNWDRVKLATDVIAHGINNTDNPIADNPAELAKSSIANGTTDEFIKPTVIGDYDGLKDGDGIFCTNFRTDRARQILSALLDSEFDEYDAHNTKIASACGVVSYSYKHDEYMETIFKPIPITNTLGEVVSRAGLKQIRTAETEKYPHVTFFLNGGEETEFQGEERLLSNSPKVATYDLKPEMSAYDVAENLVNRLSLGDIDMVVLNFANPDMVGHTGILDAAVKACEAVDECLGKVWTEVEKQNGVLLVTADHGNCDIMYDVEKDEPHTAHTLNPVNFIVAGGGDIELNDGVLGDIAPTMLYLLGVEKPTEMTGENLIKC
ncbi:MAG: 2,3-bisphosphoglycerate-independent phosphoglycerate mutase [Alphaproteobacteria bacterium]